MNTRVQSWQYVIPDYRYDQIFQSMDGLLKPLPVKKPPAKTQGRRAK